MMKTVAKIACISAVIFSSTQVSSVYAESKNQHLLFDCAPKVEWLLLSNADYQGLSNILVTNKLALDTALKAVVDDSTYNNLLTLANNIASNGNIILPFSQWPYRLVITEPDGTVVIDTAQNGKTVTVNSITVDRLSFASYSAKMVNENHNSRIAIHQAQAWPCGNGVETKFSTSVGLNQIYAALRLGNHLNNEGTARLSKNVSAGVTVQ